MKLLRDDEVPGANQAASYREPQWSSLLVGLGLFAGAAVIITFAARLGGGNIGWPMVIAAIIGIFLVKIGRYALLLFIASVMRTGWRLRWSDEGLYVRFQSYLNRHFSADTPTTVFFPWSQIRRIEPRVETVSVADPHGRWSDRKRQGWLEIVIDRVAVGGADLQSLEAALSAERQRRDRRGRRYEDHPMSLTTSGDLQVRLLSPERAAAALGLADRRVAAADPPSFDAMSPDDQERHVRALVDAGEFFSAVKAAREIYGLSLTDAKRWIEDLRLRGAGD